MKKKMKVNYNKLAALALGLGLSTVIVACGSTANAAQNKTVSNNTQATSQKPAEKSTGSETKITVENGEIKTNGNGVSVDGKTITISTAGTYRLSGNLEDGQVVIAAGDTHKVNLILDNFSISNKETAPIYVKTSGDFTLTLAENSKNSVQDLRAANTAEDSNSNSSNSKTEDIPDAAIYSKSDLILSGSGSLEVKGNYEDGIHGKDSLTIESGNYTVEATKHGINGKDNLTINDGSFTITAGQDGFNTNGDMTVSKGSYTLSVSDDGMHADGKLVINEGTVNIENSNEGLEGFCNNLDEECIAAAKLAGADDFITRLPKGYDTELSANGGNLSQGQRQLLSIARAAVNDPPVLIMDEATSSIDTRTEAIVQKGMDALMAGRTVFVIAHRLSTVQNSDVIMVLEQGEIIERGSHKDLIAAKGKYYQLYTGAFELE